MITEAYIDKLRAEISLILSDKRMKHTLAVEEMALRLGKLYFADEATLLLLRSAALLHDVTKELPDQEQLALLADYSVTPLPEELASMPTIHALTAALVIPDRFSELADDRLIDAVRYHTTGRSGMSVFEKIIFLADYIDETRTYPSCVALREKFFSSNPENMSECDRIRLLDSASLSSIKNTLAHLREKQRSIHPLTIEAMNDLKERLGYEA